MKNSKCAVVVINNAPGLSNTERIDSVYGPISTSKKAMVLANMLQQSTLIGDYSYLVIDLDDPGMETPPPTIDSLLGLDEPSVPKHTILPAIWWREHPSFQTKEALLDAWKHGREFCITTPARMNGPILSINESRSGDAQFCGIVPGTYQKPEYFDYPNAPKDAPMVLFTVRGKTWRTTDEDGNVVAEGTLA